MKDYNKIMSHFQNEIGICGKSLPFADLEDLADQTRRLGSGKLIVPLDKMIQSPPTKSQLAALGRIGVQIVAGEIRFPDETNSAGFSNTGLWELRRAKLAQCCQLALAMNIGAVSAHLGAIPRGNHEDYPQWVDRMKQWAPALVEAGLELLIQAGHQPAQELLQFLNDLGRANIYVDFNPATFLIRGMGDPVEAVEILGRHIRVARLSDAQPSEQPGVIPGQECPLGQGQLRVGEYLKALKRMEYDKPLFLQTANSQDPFKTLEGMIDCLQQLPEAEDEVDSTVQPELEKQ
jgi:sugar phosphate isomerase/epimerase